MKLSTVFNCLLICAIFCCYFVRIFVVIICLAPRVWPKNLLATMILRLELASKIVLHKGRTFLVPPQQFTNFCQVTTPWEFVVLQPPGVVEPKKCWSILECRNDQERLLSQMNYIWKIFLGPLSLVTPLCLTWPIFWGIKIVEELKYRNYQEHLLSQINMSEKLWRGLNFLSSPPPPTHTLVDYLTPKILYIQYRDQGKSHK